ncbi:nuclear transport factor 2 family protein [Lutibaculum baratangense]|uniref:Nuclear transport factor 2 family protein n=1 Tax=Lutibaculum baratangense AMV1 TaxID=631454 RepID=V4RAN8_9HYPH|nr:nuclear transport factor 2 family protein [Lutibaculum baratangense]ESR22444.1 hypothetical protein N177_4174 [Lutibaculum baratangense AMV1]
MHTEIELVVRDYLDGMSYADAEKLRAAFHPRASVVGRWAGLLEWLSLEEFVTACLEAPALPAGAGYYSQILSIDILENVAAVKLEDDYLGNRFTDYLTLMKDDGRWLIVNKVYHHHA